MLQIYTLLLTLLGVISGGYVSEAQSETSVFRVQESLVCSAHRPAQRTLLCPFGMHIHIISAFHGPQAALIQSRGSLPEGVVPCHPLRLSPSPSSVVVNELTPSFCLTARDVKKPLKQLCEGKPTCGVSPDQFATNQTLCLEVPNEMLVAYRCEPGPQMVQSLAICQDTYVEIKCTTYGVEESIVVLDAQLVMQVDTKVCPKIVEPPSSAGVCPSRLDVTAGLMGMCGRERTCSVMPDASMLPPGYPSLCARRHLELSYACVPPSVLESAWKVMGKHLSRPSKPRQPYQKKNRREQNSVHPVRGPVLLPYQQEQRDPGAFLNPSHNEFDRAAYSAFMEETLLPKTAVPTDLPAPVKLLPNNISMFPLVLGVLVGLAVLILLILLLIAFGFRTRRQRAAYARRKALSDQANTETTFSEADKVQQRQQIQQQQQQHQSAPSLTQQGSSANSYGYQQSSDSGAGGAIACWPAGLQPVPPGSNYFNEEVPGIAFPPLGRDSGSHGYVQLPVSSSQNSGLVYSHQSSTTTMNRSANHLLPFSVPHNRAPTESFSVAPRVCSPAVNSSVSTESDRFSGQASSHLSSFQPLYPSSGAVYISPRSPRRQNQLHVERSQQQLWVGYDESPVTSVDASNHLLVAKEPEDPQAIVSASFESLIEPPESFKNRPSSSELLMDAVPPRMAELRRLEKSYEGNQSWTWQDGQFGDH
ncbi:hypothetical protein ECG_05253 [Echinococcus granulosus]|uniref:Pfam-B_8122 and DUF4381 domain containing protein n=1 Tax=Echinococcus granulosus TaxID=6210 RepID=A0A068WKG0_ECHGR|nr:hypothetical protein ECG_05253 [Echinococcus granulosus]CDS18159.1 Pfam-B_8122 and DUF4381 domain containing protein [Echinococcus granulosus]